MPAVRTVAGIRPLMMIGEHATLVANHLFCLLSIMTLHVGWDCACLLMNQHSGRDGHRLGLKNNSTVLRKAISDIG
jgi:hypothetical protein